MMAAVNPNEIEVSVSLPPELHGFHLHVEQLAQIVISLEEDLPDISGFCRIDLDDLGITTLQKNKRTDPKTAPNLKNPVRFELPTEIKEDLIFRQTATTHPISISFLGLK